MSARSGGFGCQRFGFRGKSWQMQRHHKVGGTVLPHTLSWHSGGSPSSHSTGTYPPGWHCPEPIPPQSWQGPGTRAGVRATSTQGHHPTAHTERVGSFPTSEPGRPAIIIAGATSIAVVLRPAELTPGDSSARTRRGQRAQPCVCPTITLAASAGCISAVPRIIANSKSKRALIYPRRNA